MDKKFKQLNILFGLLFLSFITFNIVAFFVQKNIGPLSENVQFNNIFLALEFILVLVGYILFDRLARKTKRDTQLDEEQRFDKFKIATLIRSSLFEMAGFFNALVMILNFQKNHLYLAGIIAIFFVINFPTEQRFRRDFVPENQ